MVLRIESPVSPISIESWLCGRPLKKFRPVKVYVVEFWATWCASCVVAMRKLAQLQQKYKDSGTGMIGVAAHERAATATRPQPSWTCG